MSSRSRPFFRGQDLASRGQGQGQDLRSQGQDQGQDLGSQGQDQGQDLVSQGQGQGQDPQNMSSSGLEAKDLSSRITRLHWDRVLGREILQHNNP